MKESKRNLSSSESHPKELDKLRNTIDNLIEKNGTPTNLSAPFKLFTKLFPWACILKNPTPIDILVTKESLVFTAQSIYPNTSLSWSWNNSNPNQILFEKKDGSNSSDNTQSVVITPSASDIENIDRLLNKPELIPTNFPLVLGQ
ncbi:MAG: hypothetical protein Q8P53_03210 [Candidatus Shapirobacteria bacterium]|nr:hypothetical protein [Candidatus Shapirobacteria bacterium]